MTIILIGSAWLAMVASSGIDIWNPPSPTIAKTQLVGPRKLRADRRRQTESHRPEAARVDPQSRLVESNQLRRPHLVLAHIAGHNRPAARDSRSISAIRCCGLISSSIFRQPADAPLSMHVICFHQAWRAPAFFDASTEPVPSVQRAASADTFLHSPTMGRSAVRFLPISAGSMST